MSSKGSASVAPKAGPSASTTASTSSAKVAQASSRLYDIPSPADDGANYQMWKFHMQKVLGVQGLWEVVAGTETTAPDQTTHPDEHEEWLIKDREACAQITLTLKDEPLSGVLYANSAAETLLENSSEEPKIPWPTT